MCCPCSFLYSPLLPLTFITYKGALLIHIQLVLQDLQCISPELFTLAVSPQVVLNHGNIPSQMQDLALAFVAVHKQSGLLWTVALLSCIWQTLYGNLLRGHSVILATEDLHWLYFTSQTWNKWGYIANNFECVKMDAGPELGDSQILLGIIALMIHWCCVTFCIWISEKNMWRWGLHTEWKKAVLRQRSVWRKG